MFADVLIVFIIFMTPVLFFATHRYFRLREKLLEAQTNGRLLGPAQQAERDAQQAKKLADLQERIENLESILIDTDSSSRLPGLPGRAARPALADPDRPALPAKKTED